MKQELIQKNDTRIDTKKLIQKLTKTHRHDSPCGHMTSIAIK